MKSKSPKKNEVLAMVGASIGMAVLFQAVRGGGLADFFLRLLAGTIGVLLMWRCRALVGAAYFDASGKPGRRFFLHVAFWVALAIALFFASRLLA